MEGTGKKIVFWQLEAMQWRHKVSLEKTLQQHSVELKYVDSWRRIGCVAVPIHELDVHIGTDGLPGLGYKLLCGLQVGCIWKERDTQTNGSYPRMMSISTRISQGYRYHQRPEAEDEAATALASLLRDEGHRSAGDSNFVLFFEVRYLFRRRVP